MYKQVDFKVKSTECVIFYDSNKLTEEQAINDFNLAISGQGCNKELIPHYIVIPKSKLPIMECLCETEYQRGYIARMEAEDYIYGD